MVMVWAKGNCAIISGCFQNSNRLVEEAECLSARTETRVHAVERMRNPWLANPWSSGRTLPRPGFSRYFLSFSQNASVSTRLAHGARNGMLQSVGLVLRSPGLREGEQKTSFPPSFIS